jgi:hypothetical protein
MRILVFTILNLLLYILPVSGQSSDAVTVENPSEKFQVYLKSDLQDSFYIKSDSLPHGSDSLRTDRYFHRKIIPRNLYFDGPHFNEDNMAFNPGPSFDRMPNANVKTPGVDYKLKIIGYERPFSKRNEVIPPFKH